LGLPLTRLDVGGRDATLQLSIPEATDFAEAPDRSVWTLTHTELIRIRAEGDRFQWGQPGGVTYDVPHYERPDVTDRSQGQVINPCMELRGMNIEIAELPVLVPFLADETFTLTYGYWRNFHPGRDLHRVNRPVAANGEPSASSSRRGLPSSSLRSRLERRPR
jgi:hypothetical protein